MIELKIIISLIFVCYVANLHSINAKPIDIYDELIGDEDKLFLRMADLLSSIGQDDGDDLRQQQQQINASQQQLQNPNERCVLPARKGHCRALLPRWRYDPATHDCIEFKFGGCDGNANNFMSHRQCMDACKGTGATPNARTNRRFY